jgi:transcriptional regulator with XRE-family HTH domain
MATKTPSEREYYDAFRRRLKELRLAVDWSQQNMADALGVPLENYKAYEKRVRFPPHLLEKLALITHRELHYLVTGKAASRSAQKRKVQ